MSNIWNDIAKHYRKANAFILKSPKNKWAIDPYAWNSLVSFTPIEQALWSDIRAVNAVLYPQYPVAGFFVDFANPVAKVAIECDGRDFHLDKEKDARRDAELNALGWSVYRIRGSHCVKDSDEETGEKSYARRFVELICESHGIATDRPAKTMFSLEESMLQYVDNLLERHS